MRRTSLRDAIDCFAGISLSGQYQIERVKPSNLAHTKGLLSTCSLFENWKFRPTVGVHLLHLGEIDQVHVLDISLCLAVSLNATSKPLLEDGVLWVLRLMDCSVTESLDRSQQRKSILALLFDTYTQIAMAH